MQARLKAGWVNEADLAPPPAAEEAAVRRGAGLKEQNARHDRAARTIEADVELDGGPQARASASGCAWRRARCGRSAI